jgi:hypothetical protein
VVQYAQSPNANFQLETTLAHHVVPTRTGHTTNKSPEITRLRNSLDHLARSQADLLSFLADAEDADLRVAWTENEAVM